MTTDLVMLAGGLLRMASPPVERLRRVTISAPLLGQLACVALGPAGAGPPDRPPGVARIQRPGHPPHVQ